MVGDRPRTLLAALAAGGGRPVRADELIELVWGEEAPANATKSLQVLVSRTRSACGADAIVRDGVGYRLGVGPTEIDSARLAALVREAAATLERDAASSVALAREALAVANGGPPAAAADDAGPLHDIREAAAADIASAHVILAQALSRTGAHADALPALEAAQAGRPDDESLLADLLRSEAIVRGPAAALERFEHYRRDVREPARCQSGGAVAADPPIPAGARPAGPQRRAIRREHARRARARPRAAEGADGSLARGLDRRSRRPREDAPRACPRARGLRTGRARRRARRRHLDAGHRGRGRIRARRPRFGQWPPGSHCRGAGRRSGARCTASRAVAQPARAGQLRALDRGGCGVGRVPRLDDGRAAGAHHDPGAARDRCRSASTCSDSSRSPTRPSCSANGRSRRGRLRGYPTMSWRASSAGSTACRWRSSWRPPRCARCRSRRSTSASRTGSRCCVGAIAAHPTATRRCWR